jgi:DNA polymerase-4
MPSHIAHVCVDDFFVAVERQADPTLVGLPVVIGGSADSPGRVVAASVEAMACGVVPGLRLRDAAALCPEAAFLPGRLDRVLDAASLVDETLRRVAGPVEWTAIDEAVLDLAQLDRARARRVAETVRSAIGETGHDVAVGVADTRTAARVAARMARPRGLLVILPGYDGRFLSGLAPACLGELDPPVLQALAAAGVHTLGQLALLPAADAIALLGRTGPHIARLAAGDDPRRVHPTPHPSRLSRSRHFTTTASAAEAAGAVDHLVEDLSGALARFGCVARSVSVRVEDAGGRSLSRAMDVTPASGQAPALAKCAALLLARLAESPARVVRRISVSLTQLSQAREQIALFDAPDGRAALASGASGPMRARRPSPQGW